MSKTDVEQLRNQLTRFSALVSGDEFVDDTGPIGTYKAAFSRAATDRTRRIRREEALLAYLLEASNVLALRACPEETADMLVSWAGEAPVWESEEDLPELSADEDADADGEYEDEVD